MSEPDAGRSGEAGRVGLGEIFVAFLELGATSFGGGVVAYLRQALVERRGWLDEETFLAGLELSQILPGLNATNMSVYVGERLRGAPGAVVACLGMMIPGTIVLALLAALLARGTGGGIDPTAVLVGVGSAAVGLLLQTTWKIARPVTTDAVDVAVIAATCLAIASWHLPLWAVLLGVAPLSVWVRRPRDAQAPRPEGRHRGGEAG